MRRLLVTVLLVLTLGACRTVTNDPGNDGEQPQPPIEEPIAPPETPTPPGEEPAPPGEEPTPPETPPAPPGEEPPSNPPAPPSDEPPAPPETPPAPPSDPPPPGDEPSAPSDLVVTKTTPGHAPWAIQYTLTTRQGVEVELECEGFENGVYGQCIHTNWEQGLNVTVTLEDGTVEEHFIESGMTPSQGEVSFGGTWFWCRPDENVGETCEEAVPITDQYEGHSASGYDAETGETYYFSLNNDGTITIIINRGAEDSDLIAESATLTAGEDGEQIIFTGYYTLVRY